MSFMIVKRMALASLVALLCACSLAGTHSTAGNTLVFTGLAGEPDSLNPLLSNMSDVSSFSHLYMSYLLECDDKGRLIPEIADRIPSQVNGDISADGKTIIYLLRHGVRWQDGAPLTARDVVFSYSAVVNPANNVGSRVGYTVIESIEAPRDDVVVVHLRRPFSALLAYFFAPQSGYGLLPEHLLGRYHDLNHVPYNERPVGSGPFRVIEWRHGDAITLAANPLYWRGRPRIDRIVYRIVPDPNTRMEQLQTGEADAYFDVDPQLLPQLRSLPDIRVALTPVNDLHVVLFNLRDPTIGDVRVRRAIAMAIDRPQLLAGATHGSGIAVDADQPRNGWAYDRRPSPVPHDPAAARHLLDAAGWSLQPDGVRAKRGHALALTLTISPQGINGSPLVAALLQQDLRNVGIALTIKAVPPGLMLAPLAAGGILAGGRYQLSYYAWWLTGPDPDDTWNFACDQMPPYGTNWTFWCNQRANAAMYHALATYSQTQRIADYAAVQREILRDLPVFTLWQVRMPDAYRTRLHGVAPSPFGSEFWNAWSWTLR